MREVVAHVTSTKAVAKKVDNDMDSRPSSNYSMELTTKELDDRIRRLEELEMKLKQKEKTIDEKDKAMERALKLIEERARIDEAEKLARQELMRMAIGPISARSEYSSSGTKNSPAAATTKVAPTKATSTASPSVANAVPLPSARMAPPTARSARENPIPRDAPRIVHNGRVWVQLWDPAESAWYWYCPDTSEAQWEQPGAQEVVPDSSPATLPSARTNPPTGRSAREYPIPKDAPRVIYEGEVWVQLWDPAENAWYWYCLDTREAQWEQPGLENDSNVDQGYESSGAMTDYSADLNDNSVADNTDSEYGDGSLGWQEFWDEQAQAKYWYNYSTGEATWTKPEGLEDNDSNSIDSNNVNVDNWVSYVDEETGQEYWYNTATGETSWG